MCVQPYMALIQRHTGLEHRSPAGIGTARSPRSSSFLTTDPPVNGATLFRPSSPSMDPTPSAALARLSSDVSGWSGNCMQTAERTSGSTPEASAIINDADPTQCPTACTLDAPVTRSTSATAAGQSSVAMSSSVNDVRDEGRSMPAR